MPATMTPYLKSNEKYTCLNVYCAYIHTPAFLLSTLFVKSSNDGYIDSLMVDKEKTDKKQFHREA